MKHLKEVVARYLNCPDNTNGTGRDKSLEKTFLAKRNASWQFFPDF